MMKAVRRILRTGGLVLCEARILSIMQLGKARQLPTPSARKALMKRLRSKSREKYNSEV